MAKERSRAGRRVNLLRQATRAWRFAAAVAGLSLLFLGATWAGDDLHEVQGVAGQVLGNEVGTPAELELFRLGDFDPLIGTGVEIVQEDPTVAGRFAVEWGAMPDGRGRKLQTDAQGRFSLGKLDAGGYALWARDPSGRIGHSIWEVHLSGQRQWLKLTLGDDSHALKARVFRRDGKPYVGPVVLLKSKEYGGYVEGRVRTDSEGRLVVPGLAVGEFQLVVVTTDGIAALSPRHRLPSNAEFSWVLSPPEEQEARGRVLAPEGEALPTGTWVEAVLRGSSGPQLARGARVGPDGQFAIPMPAGAMTLRAHAPGFEEHSQVYSPAKDGDVDLRLKRQLAVRGRVVKQGTAEGVAGVTVFAYMLDMGGRSLYASVTDSQGRFELKGLRATEWMVFALGNGWVSDGLWNVAWQTFNPFAMKLDRGATPDRTLEVVAAGRLEGVVVDDAGHPVPGVVVRPELRSTPVSDERPLWAYATAPEVLSGPDGSFRHDGLLPGGMFAFVVDTPGFPRTESAPLVVKPGPQGARLELVLSRKRWIRVRITDAATGKPVPGAEVSPALIKSWGSEHLYWSRKTDDEGVARVGPLPEGRVGLFVDAESYEHPEEDAIPVPHAFVGSDAEAFHVALAPGRTITGRVSLPEGVSTLGLEARAYSEASRGSHVPAMCIVPVGEDGSFRLFGLRAGGYVVAVGREVEGGVWAGHTNVVAPATDVTIALTFHPADAPEPQPEPKEPPDYHPGQHRIRVRVTTPDGTPLSTPHVRVHPEQPNPTFPLHDGVALVAVPQGAEEFWLEFDSGKPWNPEHGGGFYGPFDAKLEEVTVSLAAAKSIPFRVLTPENTGLAGVRVSVLPVNPLQPGMPDRYEFEYSHFETYTDATGRCVIQGLGPGDHVVAWAVPPEFIATDPLRLTPSGAEVTLKLRRGVVVEVSVLDDAGKPFAGAKVQARRLEGAEDKERWELMSQAFTGSDGVARLQGLDPAQLYRLGVYPESDLRMDLKEVLIHDWKPAETTVGLKTE